MRSFSLCILACIAVGFLGALGAPTRAMAASRSADPAYTPLRLYAGTWHVDRKDLAPGSKPDELVNDCALIGNFYACQQTVNGSPEALIIFVPVPNKPGHYYTQNVRQDARASGRGDLEITGDHWVYSSTWDEGGKTTYYRTTNIFTGRDHIHFEQAESSNNRDWKVTNSGDEVRAPGKPR